MKNCIITDQFSSPSHLNKKQNKNKQTNKNPTTTRTKKEEKKGQRKENEPDQKKKSLSFKNTEEVSGKYAGEWTNSRKRKRLKAK